ncbi:MAG: hypothetical protein BWY74_01568 [Firmicutes bacterium ADurb.Bin419]|nr:MAG: hypothetical protein BWY74_01568 [Firmicutes bacterium ADurb.Bin419]
MKKYLAGFLIGVIVTVGMTAFADEINSWIAEKATFDVYVGGEKFESDKPVAVIDGSTYLPLKDTGTALGVNVEWNAEDRRVEVGGLIEQMASSAGVALGVTPKSTATATPTPTPIPTAKVVAKEIVRDYNFRSDIIPNADGFPMITKDGEHYLLLSLFGQSNIIYPEEWPKDGIFSVRLPGKDPVPLLETVKHQGGTFVKLSSVGLKARIEGNTVFIEWAD